MKTYTKNIVKIIAAITLLTGTAFSTSAQANDIAGFLSGKKTIKIKPYVKFSHNGRSTKINKETFTKPRLSIQHNGYGIKFDIRKNTGSFNFGVVRGRTTQLRKRSAQAACMYATGGNARKCMPDIIARETRRVQQRLYNTPQYRQYQNYNKQYQSAKRGYQQVRQMYNSGVY